MKVNAIRRCKRCGAVIVAAGSASRMQGVDKIMAPLHGTPVIVHTVRAFQQAQAIQEIVVVTRPELVSPITELCRQAGLEKLRLVLPGGKTRQESVNLGLAALSGQQELAAIHDGARPLVSPALIQKTVLAASQSGAAAPAIPVKDTIKIAKNGLVQQTPDRSALYAVQTPQVFDFDLLRGALSKAARDGAALTDDCSAVERLGMPVRLVEGEEHNLKITTRLDLALARSIWEELE